MAKSDYACFHCKASFKRYPSQVKGKRVFCTKECRWSWSRKFGEFAGENNPRFVSGVHCSDSICVCGKVKDYRADKCNSCVSNISEWFREGTPRRNASLWRYIKEYNLIPWKECSWCGQSCEWNGKPLALHLDHINGNSSDNRIANLRVLCPNCHTQTDTYASKNRGNI